MARGRRSASSGSASKKAQPLSFTALDLEGETATLVNHSRDDLSLAGFTLRDVNGRHTSAPFEDDVVIPAGKSATVYTCPGRGGYERERERGAGREGRKG